jgi:hypothetical protein
MVHQLSLGRPERLEEAGEDLETVLAACRLQADVPTQ